MQDQYKNYFLDNIRQVRMAEVDPEALADVAYGIFEHSLNRGLQAQGKYLFALVEGKIDFKAELKEIFDTFSLEYPQLAEGTVETLHRHQHNL